MAYASCPVYPLLLTLPQLLYSLYSQPPLLSGMVRSVVEAGNDTELMAAALPLLIREHHYWTTGDKLVMVQAANGTVYNMSRYE